MKKLILVDEGTNSNYSGLVSEFLSLQFNYGLYDFNVDKILNDLIFMYGFKLKPSESPYYYDLEDPKGGVVRITYVEEYR